MIKNRHTVSTLFVTGFDEIFTYNVDLFKGHSVSR